jgi:hypothetical protein
MIAVSPAEPADVAAIAGLLEEMDRCYGAKGSDPPDERTRQISEAIFADPPAAFALLARDSGP